MARSLFKPFSHNQPPHISRGGFLDTSCQSRDRVPLITGFSSLRTWVTQPRHQLRRLGNKRFYQASGEAHHLFRPYKGTRIHPFYPRLLPPRLSILAHSRALAPKLAFFFSNHSKHVQSRRQVDGLLRHGGEHHKVTGSRISGRGYHAPAARCRADHPYTRTP